MSLLLKRFFKSRHRWLIITLILTVPSVLALLKPGYYNMHDDMQMLRQLQLEKCLTDGQIPCRWTPDLGYGYGYPLFNYYPPLPYIIGQVFRFLGVSFMWSVKLTAVLQFFLASLFMFLLAASLFGNAGGLLAALFFTYAPYHSVNVYVRGAMNEAWAAVWFPLIFYFTRLLILKPSVKLVIGLALGFTGLMLSHNPMLLTFMPLYLAWTLFWFITMLKLKRPPKNQILALKPQLTGFFAAALLSFGLSAFFFLPVVFETQLVKIDSMFSGYYHFSVHFATIRQLFLSRFWGDGPSVWGTEDQMSFQIGLLHWLLPLLAGLFIFIRFLKHRRLSVTDSVFLLVAGLGLFTAFMTHQRSTFIWLALPLFQKIQFPWRWLNHTIFLLSLAVGFIPLLLKQHFPLKFRLPSVLISLIALFILNFNYFHPLTSGPLTDSQKFSGKAWTNLVTSGIYDYLPKTARIAAQAPAGHIIDQITPKAESVKTDGLKKGTDWFYFNADVTDTSTITLAQMYFPNFRVFNKGQPIDYQIEPELGRMTITLNPGYHQIYGKLYNTPVRFAGNIISFITWLLLAGYLLRPLWKRLMFRK